jgi:hypothetical protein
MATWLALGCLTQPHQPIPFSPPVFAEQGSASAQRTSAQRLSAQRTLNGSITALTEPFLPVVLFPMSKETLSLASASLATVSSATVSSATVSSATVSLPNQFDPWQQPYQPLFSNESTVTLSDDQFRELARWILVWAGVFASGGVCWGIRHYVRQQEWQRIEFLRQAVKEFEQDPDIRRALKILDFEEYRDYVLPEGGATFRVTDELLCNALANHDQRSRQQQKLDDLKARNLLDADLLRQYQIESTLRDWFNKMLNGLEHFGYFLESGLFTEKELRPWLNYWIKLIADPAYRRPGASKFYDALYSYIHHSGFYGVQKLFERSHYRILPSPYEDTDFRQVESLPSGYSNQLALTLAKAAYLAYQDKQFVAEVVGRWGVAMGAQKDDIIRHNFRYFNNRGRDTQAYMFRTEHFMVLAFRGSQEPLDWLTNFTTQLKNFTIYKEGVTAVSSYQGRVHKGFFQAWSIIEQSVVEQIVRWRKACAAEGKLLPPLYITGHSLGGALATMAAAALVDSNIHVAGVYTFGQPRVGDRTFVSQLSLKTGGKVFRFVNNNDLVPHVPPPFSIWNPLRLYSHVGKPTYFNGRGLLTTYGNYRPLARFTDATIGVLRGILGGGFNQISDHRMEYYISHLDKALREELENGPVEQSLDRSYERSLKRLDKVEP